MVLGPQADCFSDDAIETLARGRYTVSQHADRMGYHLQGPLLTHTGTADMVSDATPQGSLQVPGNQQPILLMADRQTTGGYPKIGVVITADLPLAAQVVPGDTVCFSIVGVKEAQAIAREQWDRLEASLE
jgi:allophanate hydrolase subunit 2